MYINILLVENVVPSIIKFVLLALTDSLFALNQLLFALNQLL